MSTLRVTTGEVIPLSRLRRRIAFWWTFGATLVLVAILGSPFVGNRLSSHHNLLLARLIGGLRFMAWTYRPRTSMMGSIMVWLSPWIATIVLSALIAAVASLAVAARGRFTALLAGWGLVMVAAPAISLARVASIISITHPGSALAATLSSAITAGLWFGLIAGWTTGFVLACTVRGLVPEADEKESSTLARSWTPDDPNWEDTESIPPVTTKVPAGVGARPAAAGARPTVAQPTVAQPTVAQPTVPQPTAGRPLGGWRPGRRTGGQPAQGQPAQGQPIQGQPMQGQPMTGQQAAAKATVAQPTQKWPPVAPKPGSGS
jgi:hypothetical protein